MNEDQLLTIFLGHRNCLRNGILHRDISLGNILIMRKPLPGHRGVLIDFDNAVLVPHETLADDPLNVSFFDIFVEFQFLMTALGYSSFHVRRASDP